MSRPRAARAKQLADAEAEAKRIAVQLGVFVSLLELVSGMLLGMGIMETAEKTEDDGH